MSVGRRAWEVVSEELIPAGSPVLSRCGGDVLPAEELRPAEYRPWSVLDRLEPQRKRPLALNVQSVP